MFYRRLTTFQHEGNYGVQMAHGEKNYGLEFYCQSTTKHNSNGILSAARSGGRKMTEMNLENKIIRIIY